MKRAPSSRENSIKKNDLSLFWPPVRISTRRGRRYPESLRVKRFEKNEPYWRASFMEPNVFNRFIRRRFVHWFYSIINATQHISDEMNPTHGYTTYSIETFRLRSRTSFVKRAEETEDQKTWLPKLSENESEQRAEDNVPAKRNNKQTVRTTEPHGGRTDNEVAEKPRRGGEE